MKPLNLRIIGLALMIAGATLLDLGMRKTITLQIDGEKQVLSTSAFTVGELLRVSGITPNPGDLLAPKPSHWLVDGDVIWLRHAAQVYILSDGVAHRLTSAERLPANLLALAGVPIFPGDLILADGQTIAPDQPLSLALTHSLQIRRAIKVDLHSGSQVSFFYTTAATLGQALYQAGVILHPADRLDPPANTMLDLVKQELPLEVTLLRSRNVTIQFKKGQIQVRTGAQTVGEALAEAGLALQGLDYSQPGATDPVPADGQIRIVRVQEQVNVEQEPIPFKTVQQPSADVELDSQKVLQAGKYGTKARSVIIRYEDGVEVSKNVEGEWVVQQPVNQIVGYGTKIVVRSLDTPSGSLQYWRAVTMYATSYSPCRIFKDRCDSYTASGATLKKGIAAMNATWYRYSGGDQVYVPGYGVATVADVGGGIPGRYWIDLGYSEDDYVSWHQTVTVYFLTPVPQNILWVLP
jgi:uncharacterized protein YabE (DUF348 family)